MKKSLLAACVAVFLFPGLLGAQGTRKAILDFLRMADDDTTLCLLHGVVDYVRNPEKGNLYLKDGTGRVLIYGIRDTVGGVRSFPQMEIIEGDTLTLLGRRSVYGGKTIEMKNARLVRHSPGSKRGEGAEFRSRVTPATFKGKYSDTFVAWVQSRVQYPEDARAAGIQGVVLVKFVVGKNGGVQEVEVVKKVYPSLDDEALRVVKSSPRWKPSKLGSRALRTTYTIPVEFSL